MGAVTRIRRGDASTMELTLYVGTTPTDATGTVTVEVTDEAGDVVVPSTGASLEGVGTGTYSIPIPAQSQLNRLYATWTGTLDGSAFERTTIADVVGGVYFEIAELREQSGLDDESIFSDALLVNARAAAEDLIETATGLAWVRRYRREVRDGPDSCSLIVKMYPEVIAASVSGTSVSPEAYDDGELYLSSGWGCIRRSIIVEYEHGLRVPPEDLRRATLRYARVVALDFKSRIPERAIQMNTEAGSFQLALASRERPTGYPEIDAILQQHDHRLPGIA